MYNIIIYVSCVRIVHGSETSVVFIVRQPRVRTTPHAPLITTSNYIKLLMMHTQNVDQYFFVLNCTTFFWSMRYDVDIPRCTCNDNSNYG